jgi:hypothetical protein
MAALGRSKVRFDDHNNIDDLPVCGDEFAHSLTEPLLLSKVYSGCLKPNALSRNMPWFFGAVW